MNNRKAMIYIGSSPLCSTVHDAMSSRRAASVGMHNTHYCIRQCVIARAIESFYWCADYPCIDYTCSVHEHEVQEKPNGVGIVLSARHPSLECEILSKLLVKSHQAPPPAYSSLLFSNTSVLHPDQVFRLPLLIGLLLRYRR
jgi:hypothetical protein